MYTQPLVSNRLVPLREHDPPYGLSCLACNDCVPSWTLSTRDTQKFFDLDDCVRSGEGMDIDEGDKWAEGWVGYSVVVRGQCYVDSVPYFHTLQQPRRVLVLPKERLPERRENWTETSDKLRSSNHPVSSLSTSTPPCRDWLAKGRDIRTSGRVSHTAIFVAVK